MVNDDESPFYLNASYICPGHKWCDTSTDRPWVVFEFTDIYTIDRLVFHDVGNREANCGNVPEYWVYVRTSASEAWTLVAHREGVASLAEKDIAFPAIEARYVKLEVRRGIRPSGVEDSAVRIYGVDIYGKYSRAIERTDGIVSVGKTVLLSHDCTAVTHNALNLLTGNPVATRPWAFSKGTPNTSPMRYVVLDLEEAYDIQRFVIWDARTMDTNAANVGTYQIYVSEERPDLSLITKTGDDNACWTLVADKKMMTINKKIVTLSETVRGRYVKLLIPRTTTSMNNVDSPMLYAFHVYGTPADGGNGIADIDWSDAPAAHSPAYDLTGKRIYGAYKGIYVQDGRVVADR